MNSRGSYQQIKQQICFETRSLFVGRKAHASAMPLKLPGTEAIWIPCKDFSAIPSAIPRENPRIRNLSPLSLTNCSFSLRVQKLRISKETLRFLNFLKMLIGNETNEYFGCLPRTDTFEPMNIFC